MKRIVLNVFMFHRVLPEELGEGTPISVFQRHLDFIASRYDVLDINGLTAFLRGDSAPERPAAALTFDDGWLDNWLFATPLLVKMNLPAILALSTGFLHNGPVRTEREGRSAIIPYRLAYRRAFSEGNKEAFLSRREVAAMLETGRWSIQSHSHTHALVYYSLKNPPGYYPEMDNWSLSYALGGKAPCAGVPCGHFASALAVRLKSINPDLIRELDRDGSSPDGLIRKFTRPLIDSESQQEYENRLRKDFQLSRTLISDISGRPPELLFWPWGQYSHTALSLAKESGFAFTFTNQKGWIRPRPGSDVLPRIRASNKWSQFRRNCCIFRHPLMASLHRLISPPSKVLYE